MGNTDNEKHAEITDAKSEKVCSLIHKEKGNIIKVKKIAKMNFLSRKQSKSYKNYKRILKEICTWTNFNTIGIHIGVVLFIKH